MPTIKTQQFSDSFKGFTFLVEKKFNNEIILLDIPLRIQDMFQRVSVSLDQIETQNSKKLKFKEFTYDLGMRTLYNGNLNIRLLFVIFTIFLGSLLLIASAKIKVPLYPVPMTL